MDRHPRGQLQENKTQSSVPFVVQHYMNYSYPVRMEIGGTQGLPTRLPDPRLLVADACKVPGGGDQVACASHCLYCRCEEDALYARTMADQLVQESTEAEVAATDAEAEGAAMEVAAT
jgi:hypothetical protein